MNTPDGPEVQKAAAVILQDHVHSQEIETLCREMERMRHRCAGELLAAVLKENPHPKVRAVAALTLARLRKDESRFGADSKLALEAEALFQRVIAESAQAGSAAMDLSRRAQEQLTELRRMTIGKPAPDFEGLTLQGERFRLREQRGKVVVVVFFDAATTDGPAEQRSVLTPWVDSDLVWIGVNDETDRATAAAALEKYDIPWPVIWDGRQGPIHTDWNIQSWPSVFVIDRKGLICARNARGTDLAEALKAALAH